MPQLKTIKMRQVVLAFGIGVILGTVVTLWFDQILHKSVNVQISGILLTDSSSHQDTRLDNRLSLGERIFLKGPVYLNSDNIDVNKLGPFLQKNVSLSGQLITARGEGDPLLELNVKQITQIKDPSDPG